MEQEVDEGSLRFAENHLLRIGNQPDACNTRILHYLRYAFNPLKKLLHIGEIAVTRKFHWRDTIGKGTNGLQESALPRKYVFHIPVERGWHTDKSKRFGSRRTIQHDGIVAAFTPVLVDIHHRAQLFHSRQNSHFFSFDSGAPGGAKNEKNIRRDSPPIALDL